MLEITTNSQLDTVASATAMVQVLRQGQLSAVELLDLHLRQIERHNPLLNALVTPDFEAAVAADVARARGEDKPLLGLPLTIKDTIYVQGLPSTIWWERAAALDTFEAELHSIGRNSATLDLEINKERMG